MSTEFEQARKAAILEKCLKYGICVGIPVILFFIGLTDELITGLAGLFFGYTFLSMLWATFAKNKAYAKFIMLYKKELITRALGCGEIYENMEFNYDSGLNPKFVCQTGFLSADRFFSNCYLSGCHEGKSFFQSDIRNVRGERGGYNLEYEGTLICIPTNMPNITQTVIYHKDIDCNIYLHGKSFTSVNPAFNKSFLVNTTNPDAVSQLLTPEFTSKILALQNQIPRKMALTIKNGYLFVFFNNRKSVLRPKLFGKYDDTMRNAILAELNTAKLILTTLI